jgi:hypothetical protein
VWAAAAAAGGHIVEQAVPGLEEVFVAHADKRSEPCTAPSPH